MVGIVAIQIGAGRGQKGFGQEICPLWGQKLTSRRRPLGGAAAECRSLKYRVPSHALVLEPQGTAGTNCFHQQLLPARMVGLIFMQAME